MGKTLPQLLHGIAPSWLQKAKFLKIHLPSSKFSSSFRTASSKTCSSELLSASSSSLVSTGDVPPRSDESTNLNRSISITANSVTMPIKDSESKGVDSHSQEVILRRVDELNGHKHWYESQHRLPENSFSLQAPSTELHLYSTVQSHEGFPQQGQKYTSFSHYKGKEVQGASEYFGNAYEGVVSGLKRKLPWLQSDNGDDDEEETESDDMKRWAWKRRKGQNSLMCCDLPESICKLVGNGRAVVKDCANPYLTLWESMVEMIVGNGLWESGNLEFLLFCYLSLNEDHLHDIIRSSFFQVLKDLQRIP